MRSLDRHSEDGIGLAGMKGLHHGLLRAIISDFQSSERSYGFRPEAIGIHVVDDA